jgi:hypothetical protein
MISINLMGGLGNQLFQISTAYSHAIDNGFWCGFDLSKTYLPLQGHEASIYKSGIYSELPLIKHGDYRFQAYKEPRWEYDSIPAIDNMLLDGYFQSPKYFNHNRGKLLKLFLNDAINYGVLNRLADRYSVELQNSVSLHVRRGDYLKFPKIHPQQGMNYHWTAIEQISNKHTIGCVLVFSDDIPWCKMNFAGEKFRFVEGNTDQEDLILQSLCNHNIISNSSFSWWGAYLNCNPDKMVIAPQQWFGVNVGHGWSDIYLDKMIKI